MKKLIGAITVILALAGMSGEAKADPFRIGTALDVGAPDGATLGVVVRPWCNWVKLGVSGAYNYISPFGGRLSATFDPIKFPIAPQLEVDGGIFERGTITQLSGDPSLQYDYLDLLLGLGFGNRDGFRFVFSGGMSHLWLNVGNFNQVVNVAPGITLGNPSASVWVPAGKLGIVWLF